MRDGKKWAKPATTIGLEVVGVLILERVGFSLWVLIPFFAYLLVCHLSWDWITSSRTRLVGLWFGVAVFVVVALVLRFLALNIPVAVLSASIESNGLSPTSSQETEIFVTIRNSSQGEPAINVRWGWIADSMRSSNRKEEGQFLSELGERLTVARVREELLSTGPPETDRGKIELSRSQIAQIYSDLRNIYVRLHIYWMDRIGSHDKEDCYRFDPKTHVWREIGCD